MATTTEGSNRIRRKLCSMRFFVMLASASVVALFCGSSGASASATVVTVNLSHQSHVPWQLLQQAVEDHHQDDNTTVVELNLSHLSLGDAGIQQVLTTNVLKSSSISSGGSQQRRLDLSMNRLTPVGVTWLLQQLLRASDSSTSSNGHVVDDDSLLEHPKDLSHQ